jgi:hypothetical protein
LGEEMINHCLFLRENIAKTVKYTSGSFKHGCLSRFETFGNKKSQFYVMGR